MSRAQTNVDFAIGATLFMVTVAFVFLFIPSLLAPFQPTDAGPVRADRAVNHLVDVTFRGADGTAPQPCVVAFFENSASPGCPYEPGALGESVGLGADADVRVRVLDESGDVVTLSGTVLSRGASPGRDSTTVTRSVLVSGDPYRVEVTVW